jgi:hypothetical protein
MLECPLSMVNFFRKGLRQPPPRERRRNAAIAGHLCYVTACVRRPLAIVTKRRVAQREQCALKWSAVDLDHRVVAVAETVDRRTGRTEAAPRAAPLARSRFTPGFCLSSRR